MAKFHQSILINGKKVWVSGHSLQDVADSIIAKHTSAPDSTPSITLNEFVKNTFAPTYINELKETTKANYQNYLNRYILPSLGGMEMNTITVTDIQQLYNKLAHGSQHGLKQDLNRKSIERISGLAKRIFKVALELGLVSKTPFKESLLSIKAKKAGHHKALPDSEVDRVKREIPLLKNDEQRAYMAILAYTDLRKEELLGLHWEDVHLDENYCSIEWTVTYPDNNKPCIEHDTKTETSTRRALMPSVLVDLLRPLKKEQGFVFGGESAWCYSKATRVFNSARKTLGIEGYNNHDFRTTQTTQRMESGWSSKECADLMGHADTRMVETVYARARTEGIMKQLDKVEAMNAAYKVAN